MNISATLVDLRLRQAKLTVSVAESASGGRLAAAFTTPSGASSVFKGGVVAYSLDAKVKLLGVDREHAEQMNCVSEQVAREMAKGIREALNTDIGISITGYAEPYPRESIEHPFCWIGFDVDDRIWAVRFEALPGTSREAAQAQFVHAALLKLLDYLREKIGTPYASLTDSL